MIIKRFFAAAALAVLIGTTATAAPTASLSGVKSGANYNWTLSFTPDSSLYAPKPPQGTGGSLGVAFQIEVASGAITNPVVSMPNFQETISGTPIIGIGFDPYDTTGDGISENIQNYTGVQSDLATGTVNAMFVPLGSTFFTTPGAKTALTFTTAVNEVTFGGIISQANTEYTIAAAVVDVPAGITGDYNNSGQVEFGDLDLVLANWGGNTPPIPGAWVNDLPSGQIDFAELDKVLSNWGNTSLSGLTAGVASVPEPSSLLLVAGVGAVALAFRKRCK